MTEQPSKKLHSLCLTSRKKCDMQGVNKVLSYGENELCLLSSDGKVTITGRDLKIESFNETEGFLSFSGEVDAIKYATTKPPLLKRIFK